MDYWYQCYKFRRIKLNISNLTDVAHFMGYKYHDFSFKNWIEYAIISGRLVSYSGNVAMEYGPNDPLVSGMVPIMTDNEFTFNILKIKVEHPKARIEGILFSDPEKCKIRLYLSKGIRTIENVTMIRSLYYDIHGQPID